MATVTFHRTARPRTLNVRLVQIDGRVVVFENDHEHYPRNLQEAFRVIRSLRNKHQERQCRV